MTTKEYAFIHSLTHSLFRPPFTVLVPDLRKGLWLSPLNDSIVFFCIIDDHSRVELSLITSDEDSSYINANFIKVHCIFSRFLKKREGVGNTLDKSERLLVVVIACNFCSPLGSLWTPGLYCYAGTFVYNSPGFLEDDLGIQCPGKSRVIFVIIFSHF